jgi:hypothetical protein
MDAEKQRRRVQGQRDIPVIRADDLVDLDYTSSSEEDNDSYNEESRYSMQDLKNELDKTSMSTVSKADLLEANKRNQIAAEMAKRKAGVTAGGVVMNKFTYTYQGENNKTQPQQRRSRRAPFELNMNKATLLSKRKKGLDGQPGLQL